MATVDDSQPTICQPSHYAFPTIPQFPFLTNKIVFIRFSNEDLHFHDQKTHNLFSKFLGKKRYLGFWFSIFARATGTPSGMLSEEAFGKLYLHCAKYPHAMVFGILLGKEGSKVDQVVPLFHGPFLAPMFEAGMRLVRDCLGCGAGSYVMVDRGILQSRRLHHQRKLFRRRTTAR